MKDSKDAKASGSINWITDGKIFDFESLQCTARSGLGQDNSLSEWMNGYIMIHMQCQCHDVP